MAPARYSDQLLLINHGPLIIQSFLRINRDGFVFDVIILQSRWLLMPLVQDSLRWEPFTTPFRRLSPRFLAAPAGSDGLLSPNAQYQRFSSRFLAFVLPDSPNLKGFPGKSPKETPAFPGVKFFLPTGTPAL